MVQPSQRRQKTNRRSSAGNHPSAHRRPNPTGRTTIQRGKFKPGNRTTATTATATTPTHLQAADTTATTTTTAATAPTHAAIATPAIATTPTATTIEIRAAVGVPVGVGATAATADPQPSPTIAPTIARQGEVLVLAHHPNATTIDPQEETEVETDPAEEEEEGAIKGAKLDQP